jgi:hypothetical protein
MVWLVYESPTFTTVFGQREGYAWAAEIADVLWPDVSIVEPCPDLAGCNPIGYVFDMLSEMAEAGLCQATADCGRFRALRPEGERPWWLPHWPNEYTDQQQESA